LLISKTKYPVPPDDTPEKACCDWAVVADVIARESFVALKNV
jgi:hypothetical protein